MGYTSVTEPIVTEPMVAEPVEALFSEISYLISGSPRSLKVRGAGVLGSGLRSLIC